MSTSDDQLPVANIPIGNATSQPALTPTLPGVSQVAPEADKRWADHPKRLVLRYASTLCSVGKLEKYRPGLNGAPAHYLDQGGVSLFPIADQQTHPNTSRIEWLDTKFRDAIWSFSNTALVYMLSCIRRDPRTGNIVTVSDAPKVPQRWRSGLALHLLPYRTAPIGDPSSQIITPGLQEAEDAVGRILEIAGLPTEDGSTDLYPLIEVASKLATDSPVIELLGQHQDCTVSLSGQEHELRSPLNLDALIIISIPSISRTPSAYGGRRIWTQRRPRANTAASQQVATGTAQTGHGGTPGPRVAEVTPPPTHEMPEI